ncbi:MULTISPECIES: YxeA family protein [Enterococcus]|jgi:uncharacterized protein (TIGR01655 family)|uniref:YxeA family protein n=1 Tax=Enterococcus dispar ATCC 51266 TaxID=1139219 RepID=S1NX72_9ENTE|nr:YxeA family protein [Enterococcus dispar]EOT43088.1 hypothetical protein OMK_00423 [Enterococcus dispar ATCC 51266]EOW85464.1 hypothetical protein I569_00777 [Enterococcus dispar ATCC 51266]MCU7358216.1 YxeA family protein [Enterococcus dispar]MDT2705788.1 YxeA family protein [Enterococcus dispar]OJG37996.1 hypothetical protein RV01_GL000626 [Enterococcus dispar]
MLKRLIKGAVGVTLILGVLIGGALIFSDDASGEFAQTIDRMNPFVKEGNIYVKTTQPKDVNDYGTAHYRQVAADEEGNKRTIEFSGMSKLKQGHYLKLENKGAFVKKYEEISKNEIPKAALAVID